MEKAAWLQATDPHTQRVYYYNSAGAVSWTLPDAQASAPQLSPAAQLAPSAWGPAAQPQQVPTAWAPPPQQVPTAWPPQQQPAAVVIVHTGSGSRHAQRHSGLVAFCCCGGDYVEVEVDEERVSTVREDRPCCTLQCCDRAQMAESVEFSHLQSIRGVEGWVPNFCLIALGMGLGIIPALVLFFFTGFLEAAEADAAVGFLVLGLGIVGLGFCKSAALSMDSVYDARPFEVAGLEASSVPFAQFDLVLENLRRGWLLSNAAPTALTISVAGQPGAAVVTVNPAVPEWGSSGGAPPRAPGSPTVMLSPQSHLVVTPEGLIEVRERCCLTKRRSLTFAERVKWVRLPMPNPCACCSSLEMGTHAEGKNIEAPMDAMHSAALMAVLRPAMLQRATARGATPGSSLTAWAPQWNCQCPKKTTTMDADFTTITTQPSACSCTGSTTLFRTEDVPWVYSERSATLWCHGIGSLVFIVAYFAGAGLTLQAAPLIGQVLVLIAPLIMALFAALGIISFAAIGSLCYTFTVVTIGTPGSASSEEDGSLRPTNTPLLLCCCLCCPPCALLLLLRPLLCSKAGGISRVYNCEAQSASQSRAFVAAAKLNIAAANLARKRAAAGGVSGADKVSVTAGGGEAGVTVVVA